MKFVIRVLDQERVLLAWGTAQGQCLPGGRVVATEPALPMRIERSGRAASVVIEWTDLDIARQEDYLGEADLVAGTTGQFRWLRPLWIVHGDSLAPRPPVTVHESVTIGVPAGTLTPAG